jgi:CBS domain-containing protein
MVYNEEVYIDRIWDLELSQIEHAETFEQLKSAFKSILTVIANQAKNEDPLFQIAIISAAYRKITRKTGELLLEKGFKNKISLNDFAWLSFGGEARREVTLKFDQDNGIIFNGNLKYLQGFAEEMVDRLDWLKIARCQGGVMASRPDWQGDLGLWLSRVEKLLGGVLSGDEIRQLTILLDADFIFGNKELFKALIEKIREKFRPATAAKRQLAKDIIEIPSYLTIFGKLALETRPDRKGKFNFKFACLYPFVGIVRLEAWDKGITVAATKHRLKLLYEKGFLSQREFVERMDILKSIIQLRLTQQRRQLRKGMELSDYFDLTLFNREELRLLKNTVKKVEKLKKRLEWIYYA